MLSLFESAAGSGVAILLNGIWQGALIAIVTWIALRVFSGVNASTRYAVWALALGAVIIIPIATSLSHSVNSANHAASRAEAMRADAQLMPVPALRAVQGSVEKFYRGTSSAIAAPQEKRVSFRFAIPTLVASSAFALWAITAASVSNGCCAPVARWVPLSRPTSRWPLRPLS